MVVVEGETEVVDEDVGACDGRLGASSMAVPTALKLSSVMSMKQVVDSWLTLGY